jgi:hypothetical protein
MRFLSSASRIRQMTWFAPLMVLLAVGGSSCENKHIGRRCELAIPPGAGGSVGTGTTTTIDVGLECPSRICLLPAKDNAAATTTSLCTADCTTDDDCVDSESRDPKDPADTRCANGFTCRIPVTVGSFCCRKLCVCKDFVNGPNTTVVPAVCQSTPENKLNCQNIP